MIDLYTGTPGSGKSLHMARDIEDVLCHGGLVIANFGLSEQFLRSKKCSGKFVFLSDQELAFPDLVIGLVDLWVDKSEKELKKKDARILLCIDECQGLFNPRTWQIEGRKEWIYFFAIHRHMSREKLHVLLATQEKDSVDKQIRKKIEKEFRHIKISNGSDGMFLLSFICGGMLFKWREYWLSDSSIKPIESHVYIAKKRLFKIYDSHAKFGDTDYEVLREKARLLLEPVSDQEEDPDSDQDENIN